jgi:hypothetical protein
MRHSVMSAAFATLNKIISPLGMNDETVFYFKCQLGSSSCSDVSFHLEGVNMALGVEDDSLTQVFDSGVILL